MKWEIRELKNVRDGIYFNAYVESIEIERYWWFFERKVKKMRQLWVGFIGSYRTEESAKKAIDGHMYRVSIMDKKPHVVSSGELLLGQYIIPEIPHSGSGETE